MVSKVADYIFFTKGVGRDEDRLVSFENALRDARFSLTNQVFVSSIYPPHCRILPLAEGLKRIDPGEIIYCVRARAETNEPNRLIAASIGVAIPSNPNICGYLTEHEAYGETEEKAGKYAEYMALKMFLSSIGSKKITFEEFLAINPREKYRLVIDSDIEDPEYRKKARKGLPENTEYLTIDTRNYTQSTLGDKDGRWTTVVAAGVLIKEEVNIDEVVRKALSDMGIDEEFIKKLKEKIN